MKKSYDVSIHFQMKTQSTKEVESKLNNYFDNKWKREFDFSEKEEWEPRSTLHHCFLPRNVLKEKKIPTNVYDDVLDGLSEYIVCWYGVSDQENCTKSNKGIYWDRKYMLGNLAKLNGVALFIGDVIDGVKEEFDAAISLGVNCVMIP